MRPWSASALMSSQNQNGYRQDTNNQKDPLVSEFREESSCSNIEVSFSVQFEQRTSHLYDIVALCCIVRQLVEVDILFVGTQCRVTFSFMNDHSRWIRNADSDPKSFPPLVYVGPSDPGRDRPANDLHGFPRIINRFFHSHYEITNLRSQLKRHHQQDQYSTQRNNSIFTSRAARESIAMRP